MNIKIEKSFVNRSKDITLLFPLLFTWPLIAQQSYRWTNVNEQRWLRTRRETTRREAEQAGDREFSGTKASLRGGLDLTSILGRVHSRRRGVDERKVFHHQERAWLLPGSMYHRISVLVCNAVCLRDLICRTYVIHIRRQNFQISACLP